MKKDEKLQEQEMQRWKHPGGKLRELGADKLSDAELLAILISTGTKNKSAEEIAKDVINKFGSFRGLVNQPLYKLLEINGLGDVKIIRIAAAYEMARRIANEIVEDHEQK
jgi:DNA repair protein RadC